METVGTVRAGFLFFGALCVSIPWVERLGPAAPQDASGWAAASALRSCVGLAFLGIGLFLPVLLRHSGDWIKRVLMVCAACVAVGGLIRVWVGQAAFADVMGETLIWAWFAWYLWRHVEQLAAAAPHGPARIDGTI